MGRIKICINFQKNGQFIPSYDDKITDNRIICLSNFILKKIDSGDHEKFNYMILQKVYHADIFGIKIIFRYTINDPFFMARDLYNRIKSKYTVNVFCYQFTKDNISPTYETPIYYITKDTRLCDVFDKTEWSYQIDSFVQSNYEEGQLVHNLVNTWMNKNNYNYLGLGGETGYYGYHNRLFLKKIIFLTNSHYIYKDNIFNLDRVENKEIYLVNYKNLYMKNYIDDTNWILVINISKKGLEQLSEQILECNFKQIIYIGCCQKYVDKDISILASKYKIDKKMQIGSNNSLIYLVNLFY